jgi:hypothetical protein
MSTAALATVENAKLAKLIRLALISDEAGEILGAIAAVRRMLAASNLDAHWLADIIERGASPSAPSISPNAQGDDRSSIWWCWHHRDRLSPKEARFVETSTRWRGTISDRQRQWLRDICDKLAEAA